MYNSNDFHLSVIIDWTELFKDDNADITDIESPVNILFMRFENS